MPEAITPGQMVQMGLEAVGAMERAQTDLDSAGLDESEHERRYLLAKMEAWKRVHTLDPRLGTAKEKEDWVAAETAMERAELTYAKNRVKAKIEAVRNARQTLSWLQTVSNQLRDDIGLAKFGPELYPSEP